MHVSNINCMSTAWSPAIWTHLAFRSAKDQVAEDLVPWSSLVILGRHAEIGSFFPPRI